MVDICVTNKLILLAEFKPTRVLIQTSKQATKQTFAKLFAMDILQMALEQSREARRNGTAPLVRGRSQASVTLVTTTQMISIPMKSYTDNEYEQEVGNFMDEVNQMAAEARLNRLNRLKRLNRLTTASASQYSSSESLPTTPATPTKL